MLLALVLSQATAANLFVGTGMPHPTLANAVAVAQPGDTLLLTPGTYDAVLTIDKDLTVVGLGGATATILRVDSPSDTLDIEAEVTLESVTVTGAGVTVPLEVSSDGELTLRASIVEDGDHYGNGGCVDVYDADLTVENSRFEGCAASSHRGGAIAVEDGSASIDGSRFEDNEAADGGALWCHSSPCTVDRSLFLDNSASDGGAIASEWDPLTVRRSVFCDNFGGWEGGAVYSENGALALDNNVLWDNSSGNRGGAVYSGESLAGSHNLYGYNVSASGAAIYNYFGDANERNSIFAYHAGEVTGFSGYRVLIDYGIDWSNAPLEATTTNLLEVNPLLAAPSVDTCDPSSWLLSVGSPAVDAGDDADQDGSAGDLGPTGGLTPMIDADGDGAFPPWDCDDDDPAVYPLSPEHCDGIDNDCDFAIDEGLITGTVYIDQDGDGHGGTQSLQLCAEVVPGTTLVTGDCNDDDPSRNIDTIELCDGIDNNCDGQTDEGFDLVQQYRDADGDGFGAGPMVESCTLLPGYVEVGDDCNDANSASYPDAPEVCGGGDNDCDGEVDEDPVDPVQMYIDGDGDGIGDAPGPFACFPDAGQSLYDGDCDDTTAAIRPGLAELCNGVDEDCDGSIDESASDALPYYTDDDLDGFGGAEAGRACELPVGFVADGTDCDDTLAYVHPGADEFCDGNDQDCDGQVDEDATDAETLYEDADGDGHGNPAVEDLRCVEDGWVRTSDDCNDQDADIRPSTVEIPGNAIDEDCDGTAEPEPTPEPTTPEPTTPEPTDDDSEGDGDGGGCSSVPGGAGWMPMLALLPLLVRNRRTR